MKRALHATVAAGALLAVVGQAQTIAAKPPTATAVHYGTADEASDHRVVRYRTMRIDGLDIFYREAGPTDAPTIVLLHGFPTSSHMYRDLMPLLADRYHVIAPDYPGYGLSDAPPANEYDYTFDTIAGVVETLLERIGAERWTLYMQDYGAPVGFRLATQQPDRIAGFIIQNGNAYEEGLPDNFWGPWRDYWNDPSDQRAIQHLASLLTLESTKWQFTHGTRRPETISPDNWLVVQPLLDRPGNAEIQLELAYDYGSNPPRYPAWQRYMRTHQPPALIVWGKNDAIFPEAGAHPYLRDLPDAELHLLDTGHFALEEEGGRIAALIRDFMERRVADAR